MDFKIKATNKLLQQFMVPAMLRGCSVTEFLSIQSPFQANIFLFSAFMKGSD